MSRLRRSPAVHLALAFAALLTVGASFGLHPEPVSFSAAPAGLEISPDGAASAAHGCFACLVHSAAVAWSAAGVLPSGAAERYVAPPPEVPPPGRLAGRDLSGRSPPVRG
jgi:hypothetical protein